jgi:outer membrane protein OmpA-like peptidoglycan-associated protein
MSLSRIIAALIGAWMFFPSPATAQGKRAQKKRPPVEAQAPLPLLPVSEILRFPNLNRVAWYRDEGALQRIARYESEQNREGLYMALGRYLYNFGIQNFYRDTELIWRYAKLTELYGDEEDAKTLYRLVLKHHRNDVDLRQLEIYYDSISQNERQRYVPLEYYYELVDYRREVDTLRPPRGWQLNMGYLINSEFSDYGPALSAGNDVMIFTSKRNVELQGLGTVQNEDVYFSRQEYEVWDQAMPLRGINTQYNEGSVCLSRDGRTMFFARCDSPEGYGNCDIFTAELQADSTWGGVRNLGINVNSKAWDSHPSLGRNEDTLYFASDRIGGFGLSDIWFTTKAKDGHWLPVQNAGPVINTRNNEVSPFVHPVYDVLYFSSNGQNLNFGEFDIYKSNRIDGLWQEPQNIGPLVNGTGSEFYFTIDSQSKNLYYARSIENDLDNLDLYSFPLPMEAQPLATIRLTGSLVESTTGNPFERGIVSVIDLDNGIEVAPQYLNPDGRFSFNLINNTRYLLIIQGDEFFRIEEIFLLEGDLNLNMVTESIASRLKFKTIEFDNNSSELKTSMYRDLDRVVDFLLDNPEFKVRISGHTDSDGSFDFNMDLSKKRAAAIAEYIVYFGRIPAARVETAGYGSTQPIVEEKTEEDKALNRRVEFELYRPSLEELEKMRERIREESVDRW